MEFLIPKRTLTKTRLWLIRNRIIKPKNLAEIREAFPFPYDVKENKKPNHIWASRHIMEVKRQHF